MANPTRNRKPINTLAFAQGHQGSVRRYRTAAQPFAAPLGLLEGSLHHQAYAVRCAGLNTQPHNSLKENPFESQDTWRCPPRTLEQLVNLFGQPINRLLSTLYGFLSLLSGQGPAGHEPPGIQTGTC